MLFKKKLISVSGIRSIVLGLTLLCYGCGYSFQVNTTHYKSIFIYPVENDLAITKGYSSLTELQRYYPNIESKIKQKLIKRILFDGQLKPVYKPQLADISLKLKLKTYVKQAVAYDRANNVNRWRISVGCYVTIIKPKAKPLSAMIYGEYVYSPSNESEDSAVDKAVNDLVKRIVDWVVSGW